MSPPQMQARWGLGLQYMDFGGHKHLAHNRHRGILIRLDGFVILDAGKYYWIFSDHHWEHLSTETPLTWVDASLFHLVAYSSFL